MKSQTKNWIQLTVTTFKQSIKCFCCNSMRSSNVSLALWELLHLLFFWLFVVCFCCSFECFRLSMLESEKLLWLAGWIYIGRNDGLLFLSSTVILWSVLCWLWRPSLRDNVRSTILRLLLNLRLEECKT